MNPCFTDYYFHGSPADLKTLYNKLEEWCSNGILIDHTKATFSNILTNAGLASRINDLHCAGSITHFGLSESLYVVTEEAWENHPEIWTAIFEALGLDIKMTYKAENFEDGLAEIYDPYNLGDFNLDQVNIDCYGIDGKYNLEDIDGYYTKEEAVKILKPILNADSDDINDYPELAEEYTMQHEDNGDDLFLAVRIFERITDLSA